MAGLKRSTIGVV